MIRYILKRTLTIIPVVLMVAITIFTIMYFAPGDRVSLILGPGATPEQVDLLRDRLGLNDPYFVQLGKFMYKTFILFDFGTSYASGIPIANELVLRFPNTLILACAAIITEIIIGIPLGMAAARHRGKIVDQICMFIAVIGISAPSFWIGLQLMLLFSLKLGWFPPYGVTSWKGWVLPIIANSLHGIAQTARQSRSSMLEVIRSDYITTARAQGLSERTLLNRYALPNAMIPVIQTLGNSFGTSLGGTVIIESVFSVPGIGQYMVEAISVRDYPVIRSTVVVLSIAFCLVMLLVDLAFGFVDPRIKAQYTGGSARPRGLRRERKAAHG
ncbi:MAG: ABC transporter permease [Clostridiales Family XIII bacterium]|jgi:peptide/nickel transport system permease protein|nr:ABC transporter permease [Clostridiales Family XIII bacterium]